MLVGEELYRGCSGIGTSIAATGLAPGPVGLAGPAGPMAVCAKTDPKAGARGISAFVVPMDAAGVTIEKHLDKMGQRATDTSAFALQDVRVPAENRLGREGDGFKIAMATLDFTRPGTAIGAVGVAQAAYERAVE